MSVFNLHEIKRLAQQDVQPEDIFIQEDYPGLQQAVDHFEKVIRGCRNVKSVDYLTYRISSFGSLLATVRNEVETKEREEEQRSIA